MTDMTVTQTSERRASSLAPRLTVCMAAFLSLLAAIRYGVDEDTLVVAFVVSVLVVISRHDLERHIIPNRIVVPAWLIALAANVSFHPSRWREWLVASLGAGLFFLVIALLYRGGLGMGDVKLVAFMGAALGENVVTALVIGTLLSAAVAAMILFREGAAARKRAIPLGPFLAAGAIIVLLFL
jgi:leader peptidase (prepilin peptidase)/N-methyltransferase